MSVSVGGPDVAEPEPHSRCSGSDRDPYGRPPTPALTSSPMAICRSAVQQIRSANGIGAAALAARLPLVDHDGQGGDRLLAIFPPTEAPSSALAPPQQVCGASLPSTQPEPRSHSHAGTRPVPQPGHADSPSGLHVVDIEANSSTQTTTQSSELSARSHDRFTHLPMSVHLLMHVVRVRV